MPANEERNLKEAFAGEKGDRLVEASPLVRRDYLELSLRLNLGEVAQEGLRLAEELAGRAVNGLALIRWDNEQQHFNLLAVQRVPAELIRFIGPLQTHTTFYQADRDDFDGLS